MRPVEKESKGKNKATPLGAFTPPCSKVVA